MNKESKDPATPKEEELLKLLVKEHAYYQKMLGIAKEEHARLKAQCPLSHLQPLLKQRLRILALINSLNKSAAPLKNYWLAAKKKTDPLSAQIHEELSALNTLVKDLLKTDLSNQRCAKKRLSELKQRSLDPKVSAQ